MTTSSKMQIGELTFGVEIELIGLTQRAACRVIAEKLGGVNEGYEVRLSDGRRWKAVYDGSLTNGSAGACEVVTPILRLGDVPALVRVIDGLKAAGAFIDPSCGLHIHVGTQKLSLQGILNVANYISRREDLFIAALQISESRLGRFTKPIEPTFVDELNGNKPRTQEQLRDAWYACNGDSYSRGTASGRIANHYDESRYHGLNLHSMFYQNRGTIEFRYFNGTIDSATIRAYVLFCLCLVARCQNASWISPKRVGMVTKGAMNGELRWMGLNTDRASVEILTAHLPGKTRAVASAAA